MKEHLLETKQTPTHLSNLPKKIAIKDKIEQLGFQRVGVNNGQPRVTRFEYLVMLSEIKKCKSQHVLLHPQEWVIALLETGDKCKNDQCSTS
jgi:hypothetical protein